MIMFPTKPRGFLKWGLGDGVIGGGRGVEIMQAAFARTPKHSTALIPTFVQVDATKLK